MGRMMGENGYEIKATAPKMKSGEGHLHAPNFTEKLLFCV
jgi:hypothetical protein